MADDRMYLVHVPSLLGVSIGKRYGWGWGPVRRDLSERVEALFKEVEFPKEAWSLEGDQNDFVIATESRGLLIPSSKQDESGIIEFHPTGEIQVEETDDNTAAAYTMRNELAIFAAKLAIRHGWNAGWGRDANSVWDDEWRTVVYIDTPEGQLCWHMGPDQQELAKEQLPEYEGEWDGYWYPKHRQRMKEVSSEKEDAPHEMVEKPAFKSVIEERKRQMDLWGVQNHDIATWHEIVSEELGEAAEADLKRRFDEDEGEYTIEDVRKEFVGVAATALSVIEYIDRTDFSSGEEPLELEWEDLNRIREWFNSVEDLSAESYMEPDDYNLAGRIMKHLQKDVSSFNLKRMAKEMAAAGFYVKQVSYEHDGGHQPSSIELHVPNGAPSTLKDKWFELSYAGQQKVAGYLIELRE